MRIAFLEKMFDPSVGPQVTSMTNGLQFDARQAEEFDVAAATAPVASVATAAKYFIVSAWSDKRETEGKQQRTWVTSDFLIN